MRLIDADALFDEALKAWGIETDAGETNLFMEMINGAPTITPPPNNPLTLKELREMDGDPVWVEIPTGSVAEWCISKFDPLMNRVRLCRSGGGWFDGRNVGKSVFVYRRRPDEKRYDD